MADVLSVIADVLKQDKQQKRDRKFGYKEDRISGASL